MAKGKHPKKEKSKKKKGDEDRKLKENDGLKDKDVDEGKLDESESELARYQALQRLEIQRQETYKHLNEIKIVVLRLRQEQWDEDMWNRYMSCDGRPSLEDIRQLNAFVSKWLDDCNGNNDPCIILQQCDIAFELLRELQQMKYEVDNLELKDSNYHLMQLDLKNALEMKINMATFESLLDMSNSIDPDTGNSLCLYENKTVKMAIWANLVCNPRYNGLNLSEMGVSFTIPRDIVSTECSVRVMKTEFDHLSPISVKYRSLEIFPFSYDVQDSSKSIEMDRKYEVVNDDWDEGSVDLSEFFTIGPILCLQLVAVPSQPRKVKNWIMTKIEDELCLRFLPWNCAYVAPGLSSERDDSKKDEDEEADLEKQRAINEMAKLVYVTWKLPADVIYCDIPKLARWDTDNQQWTTTGILEANYKEESTSISFYTSHFGAFSILLPKFVSFPYQSWDLTPIVEANDDYKASLAITTMSGSVEIIIKGQTCELIQVQSNERLYLESYYGIPLKPSILFEKLQAVGLIVTCNCDDYYVLTNSIKAKNRCLEDSMYKQMALACADYKAGFMNSRWNSTVGADKIVVRLQDLTLSNSKMSQTVALVNETEAGVLAITEISQNFCESLADNQPVCADLYHLVECRQKLNVDHLTQLKAEKESFLYVNTIYQMLSTIRVFCC